MICHLLERFGARLSALAALAAAVILAGASNVLLGVCGPFTDVSAGAFCPFVLEIFSLATSVSSHDSEIRKGGQREKRGQF